MSLKKWMRRLVLSIFVSLICLIMAFFQPNILISYINIIFLVGLFLFIVSASTFVISSGFFNIFVKGIKTLFKPSDDEPYSDDLHWSNEKDDKYYQKKNKRKELYLEILLYSPFVVSIILIAQSYVLLFIL